MNFNFIIFGLSLLLNIDLGYMKGIDPPCGIVGCASRGIFRRDAAQQICTYCLRLKILLHSALLINMNWDNILLT